MAFKKILAQRLFNITTTSTTQSLTNCRISSSAIHLRNRQNPTSKPNIAPDPGDKTIFRRFLHRRATTIPSDLQSISFGDNLLQKIREIGAPKDRLRFDGLMKPKPKAKAKAKAETEAIAIEKSELTVEDTRKLLRVAQVEMVKSRLGEIESSWIPYSEFVRVCGEACSDAEQGLQFAKILDESGNVIVLGNTVCLKPQEVTKAIEGLIPLPSLNPNDPRKKELENLDLQKSMIDKKAESLVRRELWTGLAYMIIQTAGFMRLTFWELSWDVMEPICFYVTSIYFMAGYTFFLRTAKEPSFEGFYHSRFQAKQKRLIKLHDFNVNRYNELKKAINPNPNPKPKLAHLDIHDKLETNASYN